MRAFVVAVGAVGIVLGALLIWISKSTHEQRMSEYFIAAELQRETQKDFDEAIASTSSPDERRLLAGQMARRVQFNMKEHPGTWPSARDMGFVAGLVFGIGGVALFAGGLACRRTSRY